MFSLFKSFRTFCVGFLTIAGAVLLVGAAPPAHANRPIVIDVDPNAAHETAFAGCTLGSATCNPSMDLNLDAFVFGDLRNVYVYGAGVVSFGAPLPSTASLAGGPASFGGGTWFAVGLGDPLMIKSHQSILGNRWFDWLDQSGNIVFEFEIRDDAPCGFCSTGNPFWNPRDQDLKDFTFSFDGTVRGIQAFNLVVPPNREQQFPPCGDLELTAFDGGPMPFSCSASFNTNARGPHVPEPATWALLICGFTLMGAALRRRRLQGV